MTHDITFCVNDTNCPYRFTCKRNIKNNEFEEGEFISQCDFKQDNKECKFYIS